MTFKDKLKGQGRALTAHLCTIPSAVVPQAMAAGGADAILVDFEHGAIDYASAQAMFAAVAGTDCAALARVSKIDPVEVKRVLDLGAEGIAFPLVRNADDARAAVAALYYPPKGVRGFGPFVAHSHHGTSLMEYRAQIEPKMICILLAETVEAVENIDEICAVDGIDMILPAQFDLSTALGIPGQFDHPDMVAAVSKIENAAQAAGIPLGNVGLSEPQAKNLLSRGYRLIVGVDVLWIRARAEEAQAWVED